MNIEQRVRLMIGDLMISNSNMMIQLEGCQTELAAKDQEIADLKANLLQTAVSPTMPDKKKPAKK